MSDDLVQRLRAAQDYHREFGTGLSNIWAEAADEIVRLQADNDLQADELAALRGYSARCRRTAYSCEEARTEVVRLQQALRHLIEVFSITIPCDEDGCETCGHEMAAVAAARAVLNGDQQ